MKKIFLLTILLLFASYNLSYAQIKKDKDLPEVPPSVNSYLKYSSYLWISFKKDHSTNTLNFEPFSENVEMISKSENGKETSKEKFTYSVSETDQMILKKSSTKIIFKILTENKPLKLINIKSKEVFTARSKNDVKEGNTINTENKSW